MTQRAVALYAVGDELPVLVKSVTQEKINRYAVCSGDHNPLHTDPQFAATTRFGGPVAHGMLVLAYLSEMLEAAFGERWVSAGRMKARFRAPSRPGETVTVAGRVTKVDNGLIRCEAECRNQGGEVLISADVEVPV